MSRRVIRKIHDIGRHDRYTSSKGLNCRSTSVYHDSIRLVVSWACIGLDSSQVMCLSVFDPGVGFLPCQFPVSGGFLVPFVALLDFKFHLFPSEQSPNNPSIGSFLLVP